MRREKPLTGVLAAAILVGAAVPVEATTLMRASLDDLTTANSTIVLGEVVESYSYWNADGTFIFTDVRVLARENLKGDKPAGTEFTFTIMGGTVGDLTTLIIGGPELTRGKQYVLFLSEQDLPSAKATLTVRDHIQGVFDVVRVRGQLRAVSQASRHPLLPDARGRVDAPGGVDVGADRAFTADFDDVDVPGLWKVMAWFRSKKKRVNIFQILWRAGMVNSAAATMAHREQTDLLLQPPLEALDMLNWKGMDRAVEAGYRYTMEKLRSLPEGGLSSLVLAPEGRGRIP